MSNTAPSKFALGQLTATINIATRMEADHEFHAFVIRSLMRFASCDWGVIPESDKQQNSIALLFNERLMGAYIYEPDKTKIWIITEADRSCTTVLYPEDY